MNVIINTLYAFHINRFQNNQLNMLLTCRGIAQIAWSYISQSVSLCSFYKNRDSYIYKNNEYKTNDKTKWHYDVINKRNAWLPHLICHRAVDSLYSRNSNVNRFFSQQLSIKATIEKIQCKLQQHKEFSLFLCWNSRHICKYVCIGR